ncbi:MAG TPA: ATP-binding protein [Nitriliruptorales bacterium]
MDVEPRLRDPLRRALPSIVTAGVYVVAFPLLFSVLGEFVAAFAVVPVVVLAGTYGARAGAVAGMLAVPLNLLLFELGGMPVGWRPVSLAAGALITFLGALIGRYRDVLRQLRAVQHDHAHLATQLRSREADLRHVVAKMPAIVYRVTPEHRFELSIGGGLASLGLAEGELVGTRLEEYLGTDDPEHPVIASVDAALNGQVQIFELEFEGRAYSVKVEPVMGPDGAITAALGIALDVTSQHEHQAELEQLLGRQQEANERLESLNAMKDSFLQAVSHELRTPLTSVRGFAATLGRHRHSLTDEGADLLFERLVANADKLDRLLNDLLDVDRLERGILEPRRSVVQVGRLACELADTIETGTRRLTLDVEEVTAWVDGPKVERIVENLLGNAVKHTPDGTRITLVVAASPDGVRLEVRQEGVPVPDGLKQVIFEPFRQGPLRTGHQPGTGIGLSLVSRFAELHGGRAWVQDTSDGGAAFCVDLPAELVTKPQVSQAARRV